MMTLVPISAGIILTAFLLAFSRSSFTNSFASYARNGMSLVFNTATTWIMIKTGMYMLSRSMAVKANKLKDREYKITGGMKANVMRESNNLEKMRAASTMRQIAVRKGTDLLSTGTPRALSPYIGSPGSPFLRSRGTMGTMVSAGGMEDVELGHRKTASSQVYLMPER
jgi:hypothetical protein